MKKMSLFLVLMSFSLTALASEGSLDTQVRCTGVAKDGMVVAIDIKLDLVDRVVEVLNYDMDAVYKADLQKLGTPSVFLKVGKKGEIAIFGFRTYNEDFETTNNISYVAGQPSLATLELGEQGAQKATSKIKCEIR